MRIAVVRLAENRFLQYAVESKKLTEFSVAETDPWYQLPYTDIVFADHDEASHSSLEVFSVTVGKTIESESGVTIEERELRQCTDEEIVALIDALIDGMRQEGAYPEDEHPPVRH